MFSIRLLIFGAGIKMLAMKTVIAVFVHHEKCFAHPMSIAHDLIKKFCHEKNLRIYLHTTTSNFDILETSFLQFLGF